MKTICFDIGGTYTKYGIIEDGKIIMKNQFPTKYHLGLERFKERIRTLTKQLITDYEVEGIGISCCGTIDAVNRKIINPPASIEKFKDLNFIDLFKEFNLPIAADNDVNCFALAEINQGFYNFNNFIVITIGTGIGSGIIFDRKLFRGSNYQAGEVGRIKISHRTWEQVSSVKSLIIQARRHHLPIKSGVELFELYDQKNPKACQLVDDWYRGIVKVLNNLIFILDPEAIIIGGGISNRETFIDEINAKMKETGLDKYNDKVQIKKASFKNDGGIIGAYYHFVNSQNKE